MKKLVVIVLCLMAVNTPAQAASSHKPVDSYTVNMKQQLIAESNRIKLNKAISTAISRTQKTPYVFSGSTPAGWDCSGMVRWIYEQAGITLPHSADDQAHLGVRVSQPAYGDIIVFAHRGQQDFYHAAIYLGQGLILNANREYNTTVIEPLTNFKHSQVRYVRII